MARSLAAEGYVVLAVDLFDGKVGKDANEARELSSKVKYIFTKVLATHLQIPAVQIMLLKKQRMLGKKL